MFKLFTANKHIPLHTKICSHLRHNMWIRPIDYILELKVNKRCKVANYYINDYVPMQDGGRWAHRYNGDGEWEIKLNWVNDRVTAVSAWRTKDGVITDNLDIHYLNRIPSVNDIQYDIYEWEKLNPISEFKNYGALSICKLTLILGKVR